MMFVYRFTPMLLDGGASGVWGTEPFRQGPGDFQYPSSGFSGAGLFGRWPDSVPYRPWYIGQPGDYYDPITGRIDYRRFMLMSSNDRPFTLRPGLSIGSGGQSGGSRIDLLSSSQPSSGDLLALRYGLYRDPSLSPFGLGLAPLMVRDDAGAGQGAGQAAGQGGAAEVQKPIVYDRINLSDADKAHLFRQMYDDVMRHGYDPKLQQKFWAAANGAYQLTDQDIQDYYTQRHALHQRQQSEQAAQQRTVQQQDQGTKWERLWETMMMMMMFRGMMDG